MPMQHTPKTPIGQDVIERSKALMKSIIDLVPDKDSRRMLLMKVQTIAVEALEMDRIISDAKLPI